MQRLQESLKGTINGQENTSAIKHFILLFYFDTIQGILEILDKNYFTEKVIK